MTDFLSIDFDDIDLKKHIEPLPNDDTPKTITDINLHAIYDPKTNMILYKNKRYKILNFDNRTSDQITPIFDGVIETKHGIFVYNTLDKSKKYYHNIVLGYIAVEVLDTVTYDTENLYTPIHQDIGKKLRQKIIQKIETLHFSYFGIRLDDKKLKEYYDVSRYSISRLKKIITELEEEFNEQCMLLDFNIFNLSFKVFEEAVPLSERRQINVDNIKFRTNFLKRLRKIVNIIELYNDFNMIINGRYLTSKEKLALYKYFTSVYSKDAFLKFKDNYNTDEYHDEHDALKELIAERVYSIGAVSKIQFIKRSEVFLQDMIDTISRRSRRSRGSGGGAASGILVYPENKKISMKLLIPEYEMIIASSHDTSIDVSHFDKINIEERTQKLEELAKPLARLISIINMRRDLFDSSETGDFLATYQPDSFDISHEEYEEIMKKLRKIGYIIKFEKDHSVPASEKHTYTSLITLPEGDLSKLYDKCNIKNHIVELDKQLLRKPNILSILQGMTYEDLTKFFTTLQNIPKLMKAVLNIKTTLQSRGVDEHLIDACFQNYSVEDLYKRELYNNKDLNILSCYDNIGILIRYYEFIGDPPTDILALLEENNDNFLKIVKKRKYILLISEILEQIYSITGDLNFDISSLNSKSPEDIEAIFEALNIIFEIYRLANEIGIVDFIKGKYSQAGLGTLLLLDRDILDGIVPKLSKILEIKRLALNFKINLNDSDTIDRIGVEFSLKNLFNRSLQEITSLFKILDFLDDMKNDIKKYKINEKAGLSYEELIQKSIEFLEDLKSQLGKYDRIEQLVELIKIIYGTYITEYNENKKDDDKINVDIIKNNDITEHIDFIKKTLFIGEEDFSEYYRLVTDDPDQHKLEAKKKLYILFTRDDILEINISELDKYIEFLEQIDAHIRNERKEYIKTLKEEQIRTEEAMKGLDLILDAIMEPDEEVSEGQKGQIFKELNSTVLPFGFGFGIALETYSIIERIRTLDNPTKRREVMKGVLEFKIVFLYINRNKSPQTIPERNLSINNYFHKITSSVEGGVPILTDNEFLRNANICLILHQENNNYSYTPNRNSKFREVNIIHSEDEKTLKYIAKHSWATQPLVSSNPSFCGNFRYDTAMLGLTTLSFKPPTSLFSLLGRTGNSVIVNDLEASLDIDKTIFRQSVSHTFKSDTYTKVYLDINNQYRHDSINSTFSDYLREELSKINDDIRINSDGSSTLPYTIADLNMLKAALELIIDSKIYNLVINKYVSEAISILILSLDILYDEFFHVYYNFVTKNLSCNKEAIASLLFSYLIFLLYFIKRYIESKLVSTKKYICYLLLARYRFVTIGQGKSVEDEFNRFLEEYLKELFKDSTGVSESKGGDGDTTNYNVSIEEIEHDYAMQMNPALKLSLVTIFCNVKFEKNFSNKDYYDCDVDFPKRLYRSKKFIDLFGSISIVGLLDLS